MNYIQTALQKAQKINLDNQRYGTFAEIGAGQEVVRLFFQASGSAATIAKSLSAYDMTVSDNIYGHTQRYASDQRIHQMLERESKLTLERLYKIEGKEKAFFTFANTVSARNYKGTNRCHGWMGVDFQNAPHQPFNRIIVHFNLYDNTNTLQQEVVGILGVNLLDAAFYYSEESENFLKKLFEGLNQKRVEIDAVEFSGAKFKKIDNRLISLHLVRMGLSHAVMFDNFGKILLPSEEFYKQNLIIQRGSFFPLTNLHLDIIQSGIAKYRQTHPKKKIMPIMEISMNNLFTSTNKHDNLESFLKRADMLCATGANVLITDYPEFYRLSQYLRKNTNEDIIICLGANIIKNIFDEKYYKGLDGGLLESLGRMFKKNVKLLAYPYKNLETEEFIDLENLKIKKEFQGLLEYFKQQKYILDLDNYHNIYLGYSSEYIVKMIQNNNPKWRNFVPSIIEKKIKKEDFDYYNNFNEV